MSSHKTLTSNDPMPIGKHKGRRMIDVPAGWLKWFKENGSPGNIMDYIEDNWESIQLELGEKPDTNVKSKPPSNFKPVQKAHQGGETVYYKPKAGPITGEEITELVSNRDLDITGVIDAVVNYSNYDNNQLEDLAQQLHDYCLALQKHRKEPEKEDNSFDDDFFAWGETKQEKKKDPNFVSSDELPF